MRATVLMAVCLGVFGVAVCLGVDGLAEDQGERLLLLDPAEPAEEPVGALDPSPRVVASTPPVCAAGATQSCVCTSGQSGAQACDDDRTGWGACVCSAPAVQPDDRTARATDKTSIEWIYSKTAGVYFAKTETTVAQYRACVQAGACKNTTPSGNVSCNGNHSDRDNHPMNCVDWYDAEAACRWAGGRLPTEEERSAEASNGGSQQYPWGKRVVTCDLAVWGDGSNTDGCGKGSTWPVCSKTAGDSVSGLCDMGGNVGEWTSSKLDSERDFRLVCGGSWANDSPDNFHVAAWKGYGPGNGFHDTGVRCVRSSR